MTFLTDFADQAVVLPLVFAVAVVLAFQRWRRGAAGWFVAIGGTLSAMLVAARAYSSRHGEHVAAATVVCGGLAAIYGGGRRAVLSIAILTAVTIGITRIALLQHSWPEVVLGAAIGVAGAMAVARLAGPPPLLRLRPMVLTAAVILALFHGRHLEAEMVIQRAATLSGWFPAWCQGASQPR